MELFFLPGFPSIFLKHLPEQDAMYHSLMKSRSRNMIVEEFLSAAGCKEPARLSVAQDTIALHGKEPAVIPVTLTADGYVEGSVTSEKGQVKLSVERFTSADFKDGQMEIVGGEKPQQRRGQRCDPDKNGSSGVCPAGGMVGGVTGVLRGEGDENPHQKAESGTDAQLSVLSHRQHPV